MNFKIVNPVSYYHVAISVNAWSHYDLVLVCRCVCWQVRDVIASDVRAQAYLCGHLHTMGGVVPQMYTLQHSGFLELELADWKDNRV